VTELLGEAEVMPKTWVGYLNFLLLQWLFVRLGRVCVGDEVVGHYWLIGIVPLTGWWSGYRYMPGFTIRAYVTRRTR